DVDVFYSGSWHHLYEGTFVSAWVEKALASARTITAFRFRFWNDQALPSVADAILYEVDFYEPITPILTTPAVTDILITTATGNGNVTNTGGDTITKRGVCWNKTGSPTVADSKTEEEGSFGIGAFTASMTELTVGTKYYVRAYAISP
ncbi:unnamed protein product, partial [marine sediment metagenome]